MSPTTLSTGIVADDADALIAFYTTGLGFSVESTSEFPQGTVTRRIGTKRTASCTHRPAGQHILPSPNRGSATPDGSCTGRLLMAAR